MNALNSHESVHLILQKEETNAQMKGIDKFLFQTPLGQGSFGKVTLAINQATGEKVAIKTLKATYHTWKEAVVKDTVSGTTVLRDAEFARNSAIEAMQQRTSKYNSVV